jgi:ATP-dependent helicase/nuclease subunit A
MAEIRYTPAQRAAVEYGGGNLLLSAAAGSGKTAALTARIARLVTECGAELSEMLIVTFTKAAAAEMRQRIGSGLGEALEKARAAGDAEKTSRAVRAIGALPSARISTIHSFLYQAMKPYFPALGLAPDVRILDERTADSLRAEIMRDTVDDAFSAPPDFAGEDAASFPELADVIGQARDAEAVDGELLWLDKRICAAGFPTGTDALLSFADALDRMAQGDGDPLESAWGGEIRRRCAEFAGHYRDALSLCRDRFGTEKEAKGYGKDADPLIEWAERTALLAEDRETTYGQLKACFGNLTFDRLPSVRGDDLTEAGEAYKLFRSEMKKELEDLVKNFFGFSAEEIGEGAGRTARILRCAAHVLRGFRERLDARKRDMAALDYGDLETFALKLLTDADGNRTPAAEEIGRGLKYLFVDEFQDTNEVQDRIFRAVSPEAHRFMVGDIKQSIYRFRGADPTVFSRYRNKWAAVRPEDCGEEMPVLGGDEGRGLFMSENFRCAEPVVEFSNAVSRRLLPFGGIPFGEEDLLIHARTDDPPDPPDVEVVLVENPRKQNGGDGDGEEEDAEPGFDREAEYVADRIAGMVGRYRSGGTEIMKPGDAAILLRANRSAEEFRDALQRRGIQAVMKTSRPLGSAPSVMLLICLLNFVDNPLRDVYAAGALRSPVFSVDVGGLIEIRRAAGDMPLYAGVEALASIDAGGETAPESGEGSLSASCRNIREWLIRQRAVARGMAADRYVEFLLRDTDFFALDGIRENGAERDAVNRFCTAVRAFENASGSGGGLSALLEELPDLLESEEDAGVVRTEDAVSIMTVHSSKGLEFPVCFLCRSEKRRNTDDEQRTVLFDADLGFGMTLPDPGGLTKCDTFVRRAIGLKVARESVCEEMRMLYVAMTRAKDCLIVTGKADKPDETLKKARFQAACGDAYRVSAAGSYLAWILEALAADPPARTRVEIVRAAGEPRTDECPQDAEQAAPGASEENDRSEESAAAAEMLAEELRKRFSFRYGEGEDGSDGFSIGRIPAKLTVSRLHPEILDGEEGGLLLSLDPSDPYAGKDSQTDPESPEFPDPPGTSKTEGTSETARERRRAPKRPDFMTGGPRVTGAERGNATHVFLQFVDYRNLRDAGVEAETERLIRERFLSKDAAGLIYRWQLERFRGSALMDALLRSPMVKREFRFNALLPAERFTARPEFAAVLRERGVTVTVQGVVDCVYRDPDGGGLVLTDYKTDYLTAEERKNPALAAEKLLARHRNQLMYYREICAEMFGEPIARTEIYSTVLGTCVEVKEETQPSFT